MKKIGFQHFNAVRLKKPYEADRESVQKRLWISEWVVTSSQELPNAASSVHCRVSSS